MIQHNEAGALFTNTPHWMGGSGRFSSSFCFIFPFFRKDSDRSIDYKITTKDLPKFGFHILTRNGDGQGRAGLG